MISQSWSWYATFYNNFDANTDSSGLQAPADLDRAPPLAYQMTIQDSRYGFRPSDPGKQCEHSGNTIVTSPDSGRVAPLQVSGAPSSRKVPITPISRDTPMFRGGSITCGISPAIGFHAGSIVPTSRGPTVLSLRRESATLSSCGGFVVLSSREGFAQSSSRDGFTLMSRNAPTAMAPGSRKGSSTVTGSHSTSQSCPSDRASIKVVTQQPPIYPNVNDLPSPTLSVQYTSSNEESQLPDDQYYCKLARKCACVNGNNLTSEMTQFPDPSGDIVSDRYFPFRILSPVTF